jgi:3-hydroxyisobutyrate dehydrogenase-like beta-hydroxyacid dehydrogenase
MIGLGEMGMPMCERLLAAGHEVTFRPRRPAIDDPATAAGATAADDFADRDLVIVCVYRDDQVREVAGDVVASMRSGSVLVNHTTGSPSTATLLEAGGATHGVRFLDCALSGGPDAVRSGALTLLVGGEETALEEVRPALAAYADPILHVGAVGDGQRIKLVNNALLGAQAALVAEAERVAGELGVIPAVALDAIQHCSGDSRILRTAAALGSAARMQELAGPFIQKDVEVAEAVASELGADLGRLGTSLYRLADREEIKELKARYFRFNDTKQWAEFRDLFTDDCQHWLPQDSPTPFMTNEQYFDNLEEMLTPGVTTHHGQMPEISFTSGSEAEGIWSMSDYVQIDPPSGRVSIKGYGYYYETYRKCDDGKWRISSKRNDRLRVDQVPWTLPETQATTRQQEVDG